MGIIQVQWSTIRWSLWFDLGCVLNPRGEHLQSPLGQPIALSVPHCATQGESPWSILWHPGRPQKTRQGLHQILVTSNRFITICYIYCKYHNIQSHHNTSVFQQKYNRRIHKLWIRLKYHTFNSCGILMNLRWRLLIQTYHPYSNSQVCINIYI